MGLLGQLSKKNQFLTCPFAPPPQALTDIMNKKCFFWVGEEILLLFLLESQLQLQCSTLFLHLYKARQPHSGALDKFFSNPLHNSNPRIRQTCLKHVIFFFFMHTNIIFFLIKFQAIFYPSTKIYILLAENPPPLSQRTCPLRMLFLRKGPLFLIKLRSYSQ